MPLSDLLIRLACEKNLSEKIPLVSTCHQTGGRSQAYSAAFSQGSRISSLACADRSADQGHQGDARASRKTTAVQRSKTLATSVLPPMSIAEIGERDRNLIMIRPTALLFNLQRSLEQLPPGLGVTVGTHPNDKQGRVTSCRGRAPLQLQSISASAHRAPTVPSPAC